MQTRRLYNLWLIRSSPEKEFQDDALPPVPVTITVIAQLLVYVQMYVREHQFNLKRGAMVFFLVKIFFATSCSDIFVFYKNNIFKAQRANRIFFYAHFTDHIFFLKTRTHV